jgi:hypothetical protein
MSFSMKDSKIFADIKRLLWAAVEVNGAKLEKGDLEACWDEFIAPLFGLPVPPFVNPFFFLASAVALCH